MIWLSVNLSFSFILKFNDLFLLLIVITFGIASQPPSIPTNIGTSS